MRTAEDCERRIRAIYGAGAPGEAHPARDAHAPPADARGPLDGDLTAAAGVLHVTAVARAAGAPREAALRTIAVGSGSPRSATDCFLLNLARARADAIVTTGKILRDEPDVEHVLQGVDGEPEALAAWRRDRLSKTAPPLSVVLSRGRGLDFDHPLFHSAARVLVVTTPEGAAALHMPARRAGVELVARPAPGIADAIDYLRRERGCATISVEAGPSTTASLYAPELRVDELMLSVFEERPLAEGELAGPFLAEGEIDRLLPLASARQQSAEESGRWSFVRRRRQPALRP